MPWDNELYLGTQAGGAAGMVKISSLGQDTYAPTIALGAFTVDPVHRAALVILGDGTETEAGWLQCAWHINGLRGSQYTALAAYKVAHSSQVFIRTLDNDSKTYKNYSATMIWPVKPNRGEPTVVEDGAVFDFELKFVQLVEIP